MSNEAILNNDRKMTSIFERFLSLWVVLCIIAGIVTSVVVGGLQRVIKMVAERD